MVVKEEPETQPKETDPKKKIIKLLCIAIGLLTCIFLYQIFHPYFSDIHHFFVSHRRQLISLLLTGCKAAIFILILAPVWNWFVKRQENVAITKPDETSVFLGFDKQSGEKIHLKESSRTMHAQVIGTTNAGKTASVILPWAAQDIEQGRGLIVVDGKSDRSLLDKLYSYAVKAGRQKDFMVFSLANPFISSTYNPMAEGSPEQITERFFSTLTMQNEFYKNLQFEALRTVIALVTHRGEKPMPGVIRELLQDQEKLSSWTNGLNDKALANEIKKLLKYSKQEYSENLSGIVTALGNFSLGATAKLYNVRNPEIDLLDVIRRQKICYFQLPTMMYQNLGAVTGKLVLQNLQSVVSEIQVTGLRSKSLFTVYLDDFNDYIYPGFVSLLNKSRSANVGIVFAHQSLGDLEKVSPDFKQIVLTNTNIKIIMVSNDPATAEHFAMTIGTKGTEKTTERRTATLLGESDTGEKSVREVEEYVIHPNKFKATLEQGEGIVMIPHRTGRIVKHVKFAMVPDLPPISLPIRDLPLLDLAKAATFETTVASHTDDITDSPKAA